jgi:hypothetical protein
VVDEGQQAAEQLGGQVHGKPRETGGDRKSVKRGPGKRIVEGGGIRLADVGSMGRRSSIRIRIPVAPLPSSDTQPTNSSPSDSEATLNTLGREISNMPALRGCVSLVCLPFFS